MKTILVVDDVPVNIQLLSTYLSSEGYTIISAKDGQHALDMVYENTPDLVLLDVMMPKINGFEVCKKLKSSEDTKFIPVIMLTALNDLENKIKGMDSGADDFITKPFNRMELLARVRSLLRIKYLHDELQKKIIELQSTKEELRQLSITDGLTGLYNYRYFKEQFTQEISRALRHALNVSLIMIDIDHFKNFNDQNGHPAGDRVLQELGSLLKSNIRNIDMAARYGGEEFTLILIETDKNSALVVAEKIRKLIETNKFHHEEKQPLGKITISSGLSTFPEDGHEFSTLVEKADQRLYRAKQAGRNILFADS